MLILSDVISRIFFIMPSDNEWCGESDQVDEKTSQKTKKRKKEKKEEKKVRKK